MTVLIALLGVWLVLEAEMRLGRVRVHYNSVVAEVLLPDPKKAITIGRHILTAYPQLDRHYLAHEQQHVNQFYRYGLIGFLLAWVYCHLKYGYDHRRNPMEREASEAGRRQFLADFAQGRVKR